MPQSSAVSRPAGMELRSPPVIGLLREVLLVSQKASDYVNEFIELLTRRRFGPTEA